MARGPKIKAEEVEKAKVLKNEGKSVKEICAALGRTPPTVRKMLKVGY
jgi:predicted transcriptional regulator